LRGLGGGGSVGIRGEWGLGLRRNKTSEGVHAASEDARARGYGGLGGGSGWSGENVAHIREDGGRVTSGSSGRALSGDAAQVLRGLLDGLRLLRGQGGTGTKGEIQGLEFGSRLLLLSSLQHHLPGHLKPIYLVLKAADVLLLRRY
jgi:hypothetical protein